MSMSEQKWNGNGRIVSVLVALMAVAAICPAAEAMDLETGFRNPPHSAGVRCFWWWLNSNVTNL